MSFILKEKFDTMNKENKSYYFEIERESRYSDLHGKILDGCYHITTDGSKHLLKTPLLSNFSLSFMARFMAPYNETKSIRLIFGYNRLERSGYAILVNTNPDKDNSFTFSLVKINTIHETVLKTVTVNKSDFAENRDFPVTITLCDDKILGSFGGLDFSFDLPCLCRGLFGISDYSAVGGFAISDLSLFSENEIDKTTMLKPLTLKIPQTYGNTIPLYVKLEIVRYKDSDYDTLVCDFWGSNAEREDGEIYEDCWLYSSDDITDPFLRLIENENEQDICIWNGTGTFHNPKEFNGVLNGLRFMGKSREYPYTKTIPIERITNPEELVISFGYCSAFMRGTMSLRDKHEFLFNSKGCLLWDGDLLDKEVIAETKSGANKRIVSMIPKDIPRYDMALAHAIGNHYFFDDEQINFTLCLYTTYAPELLSVVARIESVYGEHICDVKTSKPNFTPFKIPKYTQMDVDVALLPMELGVYHLVYDVFLGSERVYSHISAFEVFKEGSELSPQEAVGLPEMHEGDGGPLRLQTDISDPWNLCRDQNTCHYFSCAMYHSIFAEDSQVWRLLKLYRRKWFLWFNQRTIGNKTFADFPNCIKHADYINYTYPVVEESPSNWCRHDLWRYSVYTPAMLEILAEFLNQNPDLAKRLGIEDVLKEYTLEMHYRLFDTCADEWVKYATVRIAESFKKQWEPIKALNPKAKRSSYGPIPIYSVQYKTAYSTKFFGQDLRNLDKVFDGFWQYEDYPKWCDYHYGVGAFSLMTYKLYSPSTTIRPEVYTSTLEAYCPDGFVGKALPTKEHYYHPTYVNASQMLEYAYNTAYFRDGSFGYWNDSCYMWWPHPEIGEVNPIMDFLEAQRKILSYRPSHPKKAITFVVDFIPEEDVLDHEIHHDSIYNISEANVCYLNEVCRKSGLPMGAGTDWDGVMELSAEQIDVLVLPSMRQVSKEVREKIRTLYNDGVALFAVSDVTGLEDIFGVAKNICKSKIHYFKDLNGKETVLPVECNFNYTVTDATVLLSADDKYPVLTQKGRAVLLNTCISRAGIDMWNPSYIGRPNVSKKLKEAVTTIFRTISNPVAMSDVGTGLVAFAGTDGNDYLLVSDCTGNKATPIDFEKENKLLVTFNGEVKRLVPMELNSKADVVLSLGNQKSFGVVTVRPMESRLFRIEK